MVSRMILLRSSKFLDAILDYHNSQDHHSTAISSGGRCGEGCGSSTYAVLAYGWHHLMLPTRPISITPAVVYFPNGSVDLKSIESG